MLKACICMPCEIASNAALTPYVDASKYDFKEWPMPEGSFMCTRLKEFFDDVSKADPPAECPYALEHALYDVRDELC